MGFLLRNGFAISRTDIKLPKPEQCDEVIQAQHGVVRSLVVSDSGGNRPFRTCEHQSTAPPKVKFALQYQFQLRAMIQ